MNPASWFSPAADSPFGRAVYMETKRGTDLSCAVGLERPEHEETLEENPADVDAAEVAVPGRHGGLDGLAEGAAKHRIHLERGK